MNDHLFLFLFVVVFFFFILILPKFCFLFFVFVFLFFTFPLLFLGLKNYCLMESMGKKNESSKKETRSIFPFVLTFFFFPNTKHSQKIISIF